MKTKERKLLAKQKGTNLGNFVNKNVNILLQYEGMRMLIMRTDKEVVAIDIAEELKYENAKIL